MSRVWDIEFERGEIIEGVEMHPCFVCQEPTHFIEMNYEGHICSPKCLDKMDNDYFSWLNRSLAMKGGI